MEGVLATAETLSCVLVCSECIQLVTEDAVNREEVWPRVERQLEWTDVKSSTVLATATTLHCNMCVYTHDER